MNFLFSNQPFSTSYQCYPVSFFPRTLHNGVEKGGKIIMPPSALQVLTRQNVQYPMLFKLTNEKGNRTTHCGVLEFIADEGKIFVPYWMLQNLNLEEGGYVTVSSASLPVASFARFQPQSTDFLDISDPKAVLENLLRDFACLTVGDIIAITYNERVYELKVLETKPQDAVSIIECDMSVDFAPPVGYVENEAHSRSKKKDRQAEEEDDHPLIPAIAKGFQAFSGTGHRLDGKEKRTANMDTCSSESGSSNTERGIPNYSYQPGTINFFRNTRACTPQSEEPTPFKPFGGVGYQLKPKAKG